MNYLSVLVLFKHAKNQKKDVKEGHSSQTVQRSEEGQRSSQKDQERVQEACQDWSRTKKTKEDARLA